MHLILCIHNHQPVGNMDFILEEAYGRAYGPFFEVLKDFPHIKICLHFSGYLFTWLRANKPEYISLLQGLCNRGQIEVVSGGMYEPILALVPEDDGIAQIGLHARLMEDVFGRKPRGMWLAERVYEPHLPRILAKAHMAYTLVDDNHFKAVGFRDEELFGYFTTEFEGRQVSIFPGLEELRYAIPFKPVEQIDGFFRRVEEREGDLAVFGDDGEKFGLWPGTYDSVYGEGWLKGFFEYLSDNRDWLETVTFSEYMAAKPPKGHVYLDCQSYKEMGEWSLPAHLTNWYSDRMRRTDGGAVPLLKGGYFKNFLVKYEESNDMHKKMLRVAGKAKRKAEARTHVFMGQANDSYWHGVFGGLYLPHLRGAVYSHLIEAEKILEPKKSFCDAFSEDVNLDGQDEAILNNEVVKAYFCPHQGGILYELDYKPSAVNIMATLRRRYEGYHEKIKEATSAQAADGTRTIHDLVLAKEEGLERLLHYDWHRRASLIDHVLGEDVTFGSFYRSGYVEPGDFVKEPYSFSVKKGKTEAEVTLTRKGHFWRGRQSTPLSVEKKVRISPKSGELTISYAVDGQVEEPFLFGVEFNFSFLGSGGDRYLEAGGERLPLATMSALGPQARIRCHDPYQDIHVELVCGESWSVWTFPVEVVSLSEQGFERNYQSTMIMPLYRVDLRRGPWQAELRLSFNPPSR